MLVLTRRSKDKIIFPQLGVSIHFIRVQAGQVKVGVDAPREITILRDEVQGEIEPSAILQRNLNHLPRDVRHGIRNELHQISVGLHLYKELIAASQPKEAEEVFGNIQDSLTRLDRTEALNSPSKPSAKPNSTSKMDSDLETFVLVDDQSNEREMLAAVLRRENLNVVTLSDGNELIEYFRNNPAPEYLLIDMQMPVCDGPTAINTLRSESQLKATEVYAVSGMSPESYGVSVGDRTKGVDRWFPKPLNPSYLLDALQGGPI